jgi:2C-methyl-D-erythritol 2,4-cyclodiphosphate synthase
LPFGEKGRESYPLSLKDLALAEHIPALIDAGVASLKIEGRMKSPEYVREVARVYRRLLDERRGATRDEMKLLAEVRDMLGGAKIVNVDITIIAQAPKLAPYIDQMKNNVAQTLGIPGSAVNVKATTEEGLGFTGRGEGIAAQAVCMIEGSF